jgi:ABC-type transporter Mla MlaB component
MQTIHLPVRLDSEATRQTTNAIQQALQNGGIEMDAASVDKIGLGGLQLLTAALRSGSDQSPVTLANASPALLQAAKIAGLTSILRLSAEDVQ